MTESTATLHSDPLNVYWRDGVECLVRQVRDGAFIRVLAWPSRASLKARYPVVLVPGFASSARFFDLNDRYSIARMLRMEGFDVYMVDIRGRRHHEGQTLSDWDFDTYRFVDIPAALTMVSEHSGSPLMHGVGHSMGGMLLLSHATSARSSLVSLCTVGTGVMEGIRWVWMMRPMLDAMVRLASKRTQWQFPLQRMLKLTAPLVGRVGRHVMDGVAFNAKNMDSKTVQSLALETIGDVSLRLVRQFVAHATAAEHVPALDYEHHLSSIDIPLTVLAGVADRIFPIPAMRELLSRLRTPVLRYRELGKVHGDAADYGHVDLLFGREAPDEVYPLITETLVQTDIGLR